MPGDDLLSHGETPHYHRRYVVSLLSSGWDQVVPTFYGRQAKLLQKIALLLESGLFKLSSILALHSLCMALRLHDLQGWRKY